MTKFTMIAGTALLATAAAGVALAQTARAGDPTAMPTSPASR